MKELELFIIGLLIGIVSLFYYTIIKAFFNGGRYVIEVNHYDEGLFELVFIPVIIIMGAILFIRRMR